MINRKNNKISVPRFVPKWSDPDILKGVLSPSFWKLVFLRDKKVFWVFFKTMISLKLEMFISPLRAVFRYNHGYRTTGVTITMMSALMIISFNAVHLYGYLFNIFPLLSPGVFFMSLSQFELFVFTQIHSKNLLIFWAVYLLFSTGHLIRIFLSKGRQGEPTKRGNSILYIAVFKYIKVPEHVVQRFVEPGVAVCTGYWLYASGVDTVFGVFLMISGACLFLQESYDAIMRFVLRLD